MKLSAFQCPICMSTHFKQDGEVFICSSCGNTYTQKQADSQMFVDLRLANRFRQFAEFSKAKDIYIDIINKYQDDDLSAAYWGLLLCDQKVLLEMDNQGQLFPSFYGVKKIPIEETDAYKNLFRYVKKVSPEKWDDYSDRIQIIENARDKAVVISESSKPYDVFICFKKTQLDSDMVTSDYDVANEIYNELSSKYKIFYSEKSLRNVRVRDFEPNIYYGLYTAKVMLIICSRREYLESHWMHNEWKRFYDLNKNREGSDYKSIIPIFIDDFQVDDLPDELSHKQGFKYGISLISNIDNTLDKIINPIDKDDQQQKEIDQLKSFIDEFKKQRNEIVFSGSNSTNVVLSQKDEKILSFLKSAKVNIEDLGNFAAASKQIEKVQELDAENYVAWFYKLLIDFKAQSLTELITHDNYKESINYRLFVKYANKAGKEEDVKKVEDERENYLRALADKVNKLLEELENNPNPLDEDLYKIKSLYESLPKDALEYVGEIKQIIQNARKRQRDNKINNFNARVNLVDNKEHPNLDDILKIQEEYNNLSEDEQDLAGDGYKLVIEGAKNKMVQGKVQRVQQALINLDNQDTPSRDDLIHVEKLYNELDDKLKRAVNNYKDIMTRAYDKKYKNDAQVLNRYLTKLPSEKVPSRDIYTKLENRYRALPKNMRVLVTNIALLDEYYDRLLEMEGVPKIQEKPVENKQGEPTKKKKHWLW